MHFGPNNTKKFLAEILHNWTELPLKVQAAVKSGELKALVSPPSVSLSQACDCTKNSQIIVLAQNAHWEEKGAFTGEISPLMLKEIGAKGVIIGHSERRHIFAESNELIRNRTLGLIKAGLQVVLCIGETQAERESGKTEKVLEEQITKGLEGFSPNASFWGTNQLLIAYEPVWAIGTGLTASPAQAEEAHKWCRELINKQFGKDAAEKTPILYGGSVKPDNLSELLAGSNVDGGLVGGASLKADGFLGLLRACEAYL